MGVMDKLGFGIFGVSHHHSISFTSAISRHPRARLVGVYDSDPKLALEFSKKFGLRNFSNMEEFLASKDLDVGVVTSENVQKKELSIALARSGKHVLCDKPLGISAFESREIIRACEKSRVKLQVGYLSRYTPEALEAKKIVDSKKIGKVKFIAGENRVDVGSVKMLSPWLSTVKATGGRGAILEHSVHIADLAQWYAGSRPVKVYASRAKNLDESFEVEDNFILIATYANGAIATMDGSYCRPSSGRADDLVMEIVGSRGKVKIMIQKKALELEIGEEPSVKSHLVETELSGRYEGIAVWNMVDDLLSCIRNDSTPLTNGEDARIVNQLVEAAYKSLVTGNEIRINATR
ncbi:MAG: Gfo/Idh/MocA family oxidoreductase [Thaumarchaeota archaeon]|nr:Gfo/Idh/MocA family oxidoreductase [Nitrososphaerota archaeon]